MGSVNDPGWCEAIAAELKALEHNHTWTFTDLPPTKEVIDCKYIYKIKFKSNGTVERLEARFVAKGYTQQEGIDFHETFSPVAKLSIVRCLLAIVAIQGWFLHQFDVNNTF